MSSCQRFVLYAFLMCTINAAAAAGHSVRFSPAAQMTQAPIPWYIIYGISVGAVLLMLMVLVWNIFLRRSIAARTSTLQQELAERRKAEASLADSRYRLSMIMDNLQGVVYRVSFKPKMLVEFVSDGGLEQSGYSSEEFLSGAVIWPDLIADEDRMSYQDMMDQALNVHETYQLEYRIIRRDGQMRWMLDKGRGLYDEQGDLIGHEGIVVDITHHKEVEEKLSSREGQLSSIFKASPVGIGLLAERVFLNVNDRICSMTGYTRGELLGRNARMLYPTQEDYEYVGEEKYRQIRAQGVGTVETRWRCKNGKVIDVLLNSAPLDVKDWSKGVSFTALDITEAKTARQAAIAERDKAQQYLDIAGVMMLVLDTEGHIKLINKKGCQILECAESQVLAKDWFSIFLPETVRKQARKVFCDLITSQNESVEYYENTIRTITGREKLIAWHNTMICDEHGQIVGTLSSGMDITEQRRAEQALAESEQRFRSVIESSPIGVSTYTLESDGQLILTGTNEAAKIILKRDLNQVVGKPIEEAFPELVGTERPDVYRRIARQGGAYHCNNFDYPEEHRGAGGYHEIHVFQTSPGEIAVMFMDVTDRICAQRQLELTQFAIDHAGEATFWMGPDAKFMYVNDAACRSLKYTRDQLLTMSVQDIDPDFPAEVWPQHWQEVKASKVLRFESHHKTKDGHVFPVEITTNFLEYQGAEYIWAFVRDITERKAAEEQLHLTRFAVDHAGESVFLINEQTQFEYVNLEACRSMGYTQDELLAMRIEDIDPDFDPQTWPSIWEATQTEKVSRIERRHRRKDGSIFPVEITGNSMLYAGRELHCVFVRDITERKRVQEALQFTQFTVDHAGEGAFWMDSTGKLIYVNDAACRSLGYTREELLQMSIPDLDPNFPRDQWDAHWAESRNKGSWCIETQHRTKDGRLLPVEVSVNNVSYAGVEYHCSFARDISERKVAEAAREKLMRELQAKNEELESIVFIASHDLRSPLVNIQGFTGELEKSLVQLEQLLGEETLSESARNQLNMLFGEDIPESLSFIKSGNRKMDLLLNGLLRLSRIGTADVRPTEMDMRQLFEGIVNSFRFRLRETDIQITIDETIPDCRADSVLINQVFTNLIENAIKYRSPDRPAEIHISGRPDNGTVVYCVRDNGIGIADEHIEKVFEIFHRLNPNGDQVGEGLGLTIVRRILKRQDGSIWVESEPGVGTAVFVALPGVRS